MVMGRYFYSLIQKVIEYATRKRKKGCCIYMFHYVGDDVDRWENPNISITEQGFRYFVDKLIEWNTLFLKLDQLNSNIAPSVIITFDDIYRCACENAIPYLIENSIPFCVFVTLDTIGKSDYITFEQLEWLESEPLCTIGYHSKSHKMMRMLSTEDVYREIDVEEFERLIGKKCDYFAFPYGSLWACAKENINMVAKQNYKMAFSTISSPCVERWRNKMRFFLPRINICEHNYVKELKRKC